MRAETSLTVKHAELVGSSGIMEDRIFIGNKSVIVLDGATQADQTVEQTGGWMAGQIGQRFSNLIESNDDEVELTELLAQAIAETRDEFNLVPGKSPTTTVSAARFTSQSVDLLVLGDSPALGRSQGGIAIEVLQDRRLDQATASIKKPSTQQNESKEWIAYYGSLAQLRNKPGGFWIAEADPFAATHARKRTLEARAVIMLCTDGVSALVEKYSLVNWQELFERAQKPEYLLEEILKTEDADPARTTYPRSKVSDDKTLSVCGKNQLQARTNNGGTVKGTSDYSPK